MMAKKDLNMDKAKIELTLIIDTKYRKLLKAEKCVIDTFRKRIQRIMAHPILQEYLPASAELCVSLMSDEAIQELNRDYRGKDKATDVLSFALLEGEILSLPEEIAVPLGDIMISYDTALKQSKRGALPRLKPFLNSDVWTLADELAFLSLHGILHLLGFDHETDQEAEVMEGLEAYLLKTAFPKKANQAPKPLAL